MHQASSAKEGRKSERRARQVATLGSMDPCPASNVFPVALRLCRRPMFARTARMVGTNRIRRKKIAPKFPLTASPWGVRLSSKSHQVLCSTRPPPRASKPALKARTRTIQNLVWRALLDIRAPGALRDAAPAPKENMPRPPARGSVKTASSVFISLKLSSRASYASNAREGLSRTLPANRLASTLNG